MPVFWFVFKIFAFLFLYIWVRSTLPRFRYDQLMSFGWKFLLPVAMANIIVTSLSGHGAAPLNLATQPNCFTINAKPESRY